MEIAQAFVGIRADTKNLKPDIAHGVHGADLEGEGKKAGSRFAAGMGAVIGVAAAAGLVSFGRSSVEAFKEAEVAQARLSDAFAKFPALADINRSSLDKLNTSMAQKTRFDDDALASGQATLAMFGLTGTQIAELTPLLADYAAKTGTDLPTAAEQLGKATQGQGRALKAVGIDFQDTGTFAGNLDQVMGGLRSNVGGFAETEGKTAAGQAEILKNRFGELQELVGEKLIPILTSLATAGIATLAWMEDNNELVVAAVSVMGAFAVILGVVKVVQLASAAATAIASAATAVWTGAQWLLNAALTANPIGIVIVLIAALVAGIIVAYKNSETFRNIVQKTWEVIQAVVKFAWEEVLKPIFDSLLEYLKWAWENSQKLGRIIGEAWEGIKTVVGDGVRAVIDFFLGMAENILEGAARAFSWVPGVGPKLEEARNAFAVFRDRVNQELNQIIPLKQVELRAVFGGDTASLVELAKRGNITAATGGFVSGPGTGTSDSIPALLSNGEYVVKAASVGKYGPQALAAVNAGTATVIPGFATGGMVFSGGDPVINGVRVKVKDMNDAAGLAAVGMADIVRDLFDNFVPEVTGSGGSAAGLLPYVASIRSLITSMFGITNIGGYSYRNIAGTNTLSDHALGKALDIMTTNVSLGNTIVSFLHSLPALKYTIWRQMYYPKGGSPSRMSDRGSPTQNHMDHVHASFFDNGAWVPPGRFEGINATGKPERLTNTTEPIALDDETIAKLGAVMRRGTDWALSDVTAAHRAGARG